MDCYIFCVGGLGNRINSLVTGLIISKELKTKPFLVWPRCNYCMASAEQIISKQFIKTNFQDVLIDKDFSDLEVITHRKNIYFKYKPKSIYFWPFYKNKIKANLLPLVIESDMPPWWINFNSYREITKNIPFSEEVNKIVDKIYLDVGKIDYGLHVRQGDWSNPSKVLIRSLNNINFLNNKILNSNKKIYVASELDLIPKIFKKMYPFNVLNSENILTDYAILSKDKDAFISDKSSIQGAAENQILSNTKLYATSYSSFLYISFLRSSKFPVSLKDWIKFRYIIPFQYILFQLERILNLKIFLKKIYKLFY